jgi:hypothetical protein
MSLGWLNLQDYLAVNQDAADNMATRLDTQAAEAEQAGAQAATAGNALSYGQYLAKRRTQQAMRAKDSTRGALLGGDIGDSLLARKGVSRAEVPSSSMDRAYQQNLDAQKSEADYWAKQADRNKGLATAETQRSGAQADAFGKARKAYGDRERADDRALTYFGAENAEQPDDVTRRQIEGRYGTITAARQGQAARRRRLTQGGF